MFKGFDRVNYLGVNPNKYLKSNEKIVGYAVGGSESLVMLTKSSNSKEIWVRKVWSEDFATAKWDSKGTGFMTHPVEKGLLQIEYLKNLPLELKSYFPKIKKVKVANKLSDKKNDFLPDIVADISYVPGLEISTFIATYHPSCEIVAYLYTEVIKCLRENIHSYYVGPRVNKTIERYFLNKIDNRLELSRKTLPNIFDFLLGSKFIKVNGKKYFNIPYVVKEFRRLKNLNLLEPKFHSLVVGDTNTENIKIINVDSLIKLINGDKDWPDYRKLGIKFLDPRAIGFESEGVRVIDDYMYDLKLFHNSLGNYDAIHGKYFDIKVSGSKILPEVDINFHTDNPYKKSYKDLKSHFRKIMESGLKINDPKFIQDNPYWLVRFIFLMGTHFASMPPFQFARDKNGNIKDNFQSQKRAVAIYCEGIVWLNTAYRMMNGKINEYFGIKLPKVKVY